MTDILLVGAGNMGFAMLKGWLTTNTTTRFHVVEPADALRQRADDAGAATYASAAALPETLAPSLVFLAVKPQVMGEVAPAYARFNASATYVSVAAGVSSAALTAWLGAGAAIVRTMPNTPAAIGAGMLVSVANDAVGADTREAVADLLSACGQHAWIGDEALMDAVTAISGSGPAYLFHVIECLAAAGERLGLAPDLARQLAVVTMAGAGRLAAESGTAPGTLRAQVTSPGGTTAAALEVFMTDQRLATLFAEATEAARDRGAELGKL